MILKICRKKYTENGKSGSIEAITEFYSGNSFKETNGIVTIDNKQSIIINNFDGLDEATESSVHYETVYAFIMNEEGKTIERLI